MEYIDIYDSSKRKIKSKFKRGSFIPKGGYYLIVEIWTMTNNGHILINMILLAPAGFLLPFVFNKRIVWYKAFLMGVGFSTLIEVSQLLLCRGLFEWDDILHNALGAMAGCGVAERLFGRFQ